MAEKTTLLQVNVAGAAGIAGAVVALKGLGKALSSISEGVKEAFTVRGYRDYLQTVSRFGKNLANELLVLQMAFGRLKVAIAKAFAPILEVVVPCINQAIFALIRFAGVVRQFLTGLFAGVRGNDALAASAQSAADAEDALIASAKAAGKAARRSLMGLDQLERLNAPTGSAGGGSSYSFTPFSNAVTPEVQGMVDRLMEWLRPILSIDLQPLRTALQGLQEAWTGLTTLVGGALEWLWHQVLTPFAAWLLETFAPVWTDTMAAAIELVTATLQPLIAGFQSLWEQLKPVAAFLGDTVVLTLEQLKLAFEELSLVVQERGEKILLIFQNIGQVITALWTVAEPVITALREHISACFTSIYGIISTIVAGVTEILLGLTTFLSGVFTGDWQRAWEGIKIFMKGLVNSIIGLLNAMIQRVVASVNAVVRLANKLSFKVPDWVPEIGGKNFGFHMKTVTAPQIPYLAKGAVLPANKPFLAMVGDQRHGTNIEAPLATIENAVANVMKEQTGAILAGFEASVGVQREILEAVLGIRIDDSVIGAAAARYEHRLAVMKGGAL